MWKQGLRKGTQFLKIDPHFMEPDFCRYQENVKNPKDGCFLLSHDEPVKNRTDYFTTHDFINLLYSKEITPFSKSQERLYIALCFKYDGDPCDNSTKSEQFISLIDQLFDEYNEAIEEHNLNVEFIIDGSYATPTHNCLAQKWRPWLTTFTTARGPFLAAFSNSKKHGYDRMQWLDDPILPFLPNLFIDLMADIDYAKFGQSSQPYLYWEPSNQYEIVDVASRYVNGVVHPPGLRFAINIDPAQCQVFAASKSGYGWNTELSARASNPLVSIGRVHPSGLDEAAVISVFYDDDTQENKYQVSLAPSAADPLTVLDAERLYFPSSNPIHSFTSIPRQNLYLASDIKGHYAFYELIPDAPALNILSSSRIKSSLTSRFYLIDTSLFTFHSKDQSNVIRMAALFFRKSDYILQIYTVDRSELTLKAIGSPTIISMPKEFISTSNASIVVSSEHEQNQICNANQQESVLVANTQNKKILASILCIDQNEHPQVDIVQPFKSPIGVGTNPSITSFIRNSKIWIAEVHGEGYCDLSTDHNRGSFPATCIGAESPTPTPYVLQYNVLPINSLNQILQDQQLITSCTKNEGVIHGTFSRGSQPSVTIFDPPSLFSSSSSFSSSTQYRSQDSLKIKTPTLIVGHHGVENSTNIDFGDCGRALSYDGILVDAWPLPWNTMQK
eukprot:gb/GECH01014547.1/.p1 GENE.gb/GECH01014547.1/~~gb/GECH01014547.1/.p1  ORF type:complete len:672 (+),score=158.42 gb/GECH01014547.1/:1-2016(+)